MQSDSRFVTKTPICVEIFLTDGTSFRGMVFAAPKGRLIDVLNDDRAFLPVESLDGTALAIAKTSIKQIALPSLAAPVYLGDDPYVILGVGLDVSPAKLKEAYHSRCQQNHPDRVKGAGLASDFLELATKNMSRINDAYLHLSRKVTRADKPSPRRLGEECPAES